MNNNLEEYIKNKRKEGVDDQKIRSALIESGWKEEDIEGYFRIEKKGDNEYDGPIVFAYGKMFGNFLDVFKIAIITAVLAILPVNVFIFLFSRVDDFFQIVALVLILGILSLISITIMEIGLINISLNAKRKKKVGIDRFFQNMNLILNVIIGRFLFQAFVLFLAGIAPLIAFLITRFTDLEVWIIFIGVVVGLFVYLWFFLRFLFFSYFIIDEHLGPVEGLKKSYGETKKKRVLFFLFKLGVATIPFYLVNSMLDFSTGYIDFEMPIIIINQLVVSTGWVVAALANAYFYDEKIKMVDKKKS